MKVEEIPTFLKEAFDQFKKLEESGVKVSGLVFELDVSGNKISFAVEDAHP
jgi:hypothetical protein